MWCMMEFSSTCKVRTPKDTSSNSKGLSSEGKLVVLLPDHLITSPFLVIVLTSCIPSVALAPSVMYSFFAIHNTHTPLLDHLYTKLQNKYFKKCLISHLFTEKHMRQVTFLLQVKLKDRSIDQRERGTKKTRP